MLSSLAAWRVSLQRMRADWPIVAAAWLITLLAATLLAAGPVYSDAVSLAGLRRVLDEASYAEVNFEVTALVDPTQVNEADERVRAELSRVVERLPVSIWQSGESETFALPDQPEGEVRDLATMGFSEGLPEHTTLTTGEWPDTAAPGEPVGVAISEPIADELAWTVGQAATLTSRRDPSRLLPIMVTGIYSVDDPQRPFWWDDGAVAQGYTESSTYRTFGPLMTTRENVLERSLIGDARVVWHAFPDYRSLELAQVDGLRQRTAELTDRIKTVMAGTFPTVSQHLDEVLATAQRSLLVSRTGVLLLIIQLAIMAGYAIVLTAGLIAEHRRGDTALLRSRGAGPLQVASVAGIEALVLAVPAAAAAPFLAAGALYLFNLAGPLASVGLPIAPQLSVTAFAMAGGAALVAAALLVLPVFLAARSFVDVESSRSRTETRTIGQRLGIDIALLAVTFIALWQLRLYGAPITESVHGSLGLDPLLVATPAIGMLAGAVLALRVVPWLALAGEHLTRQGRRLIGSLGTQEVARRPLRYTRSALLLMLAVSIGTFAVSYGETWHASQNDQAAFQVGADVRLTSGQAGSGMPSWALESALERVPGVEDLTPVSRGSLRIAGGRVAGEMLAMDTAAARGIVHVRDDLAPANLDAMLAQLADARPAPSLPTIREAPRQLRVDVGVTLDRLVGFRFDPALGDWVSDEYALGTLQGRVFIGAEVVVQDARGISDRFTAEPVSLRANGGQRFAIPIAPSTRRGAIGVDETGGGLTPPLQVVSLDVTVELPPPTFAVAGRIELLDVASSTDADTPLDTGSWTRVDLDVSGWSLAVLRNGGPTARPSPEQVDGRALDLVGSGPTAELVSTQPGLRPPAVSFRPSSLDPFADAALPVVVNQAFLDRSSAAIGDEPLVRADGAVQRVRILGIFSALPTTDPQRPLALVDLPTLSLYHDATSARVEDADEWWLSTVAGTEDEVAAAIDRGPYVGGTVTSRTARARVLSADPVALGILGALSLGFVVAVLFAAIGLAVSAAVMARQRRTEFALLRALGMSGRQLLAWLWLENGGLVAVGIVAGTALGLVIGWVALPFVTVTQEAANPFPPPLVHTAWLAILILVTITTGVLGLTMMTLARILRSLGIGSVLRMGED